MQKRKIFHKYYHNHFNKFITRILVSIVFILIVLITGEYIPSFKDNIINKVYNTNFNFMSFNKMYSFLSGKKKEIPVMGNFISYNSFRTFENGIEYDFTGEEVIPSYMAGIVVFIGDKDKYNKTVIVQGIDGYDIWYGNLDNINVSLYDFIDSNAIIGSASSKVFITVMKDDKYYDISEYQNSI